MREKIVRTELAEYTAAEWDGVDRSGLQPIGDNVLVLPDVSSDKAGKLGLITITQEQQERQSMAAETGILVSMGEDAWYWNADRTRPFGTGRKPAIGDRLIFERYAGRTHRGSDGVMYRLMTDNCIGAIVPKEAGNG